MINLCACTEINHSDPLHSSIHFIASWGAFIVYAYDKSAAMDSRWRIQERTLHFLSVMGSWPGAPIAQKMFCHKSRKAEFLIVFWITVAINCDFLAWSATEGDGNAQTPQASIGNSGNDPSNR